MRILGWHDIAGDKAHEAETPIPIVVGPEILVAGTSHTYRMILHKKNKNLIDLSGVNDMIENRIAERMR